MIEVARNTHECESGTNVVEVTNHLPIGFKAYSMGRNTCLLKIWPRARNWRDHRFQGEPIVDIVSNCTLNSCLSTPRLYNSQTSSEKCICAVNENYRRNSQLIRE